MRFSFEMNGKSHEAVVTELPELTITLDGERLTPKVKKTKEGLDVKIGRKRFKITRDGNVLKVNAKPKELAVRSIDFVSEPADAEEDVERSKGKPSKPAEEVGGAIHPPMPGRVVSISAKTGTKLRAGSPLLILEAMKMQNEIVSPFEGTVKEIKVKPGDLVDVGDVLIVIDQS
jgi:biotin carboxyl carrier protein